MSKMHSISRALYLPMCGHCSAVVLVLSAGPRCPETRRISTRQTRKVKELIPDDAHLHNWLDAARERIHFQGLPARICWVGLGQRHRLGLAFNQMVRDGELKAPVVIGRDHLDSGSVASPNRETEAMRDGSDAVSDWALLNALLSTASGATWVSLHHGGGVGMGFSQHAGLVIVCDGSEAADKRIERVLWNDPASGVMRHADAGYDDRDRLCPGAWPEPADGRHRRRGMKLAVNNQLVGLVRLAQGLAGAGTDRAGHAGTAARYGVRRSGHRRAGRR